MKRMLVVACVAAIGFFVPSLASAQDVAITNARVIVGSGQVIESGTIVVRGGKIASVTAGAAQTQGLRVIDAKGMSAMPGFIDGHKHVNNYDAAQMKSVLEAGYTTVLAGGGPAAANIALRDRIEKGEIVGPRVIASGQINLRQTPAEARAAVQALAAQGIKHTGEIGLTPEPAPPQSEIEVSYREFDRVLMNVGSVGQPRDEDPRAAYGLVDTDREIACVKRVHYDIAGVQRKIREAGLPEVLANRLALGV